MCAVDALAVASRWPLAAGRRLLQGRDPAWVAELEAMEAAGFKGDLEACYSCSSVGVGGGGGGGGGGSVGPGPKGEGGRGGFGALQALVVQGVLTRAYI